MENEDNESMTEDNESPLSKQRKKTTDLIDQEQLAEGNKDFDVEDTIEDVASDESFAEETEGKVQPLSDSGTPEIEHSEDMRKRFAKKHEFAPETIDVLNTGTFKSKTKKFVPDPDDEPDVEAEDEAQE